MKASPYNYSTSMPDGTKLLFNFFTLTLLVLKPSEFGVVDKILKSDDHACRQESGPEFRTLLAQKEFLVPDGVDELAQLKSEYYLSREDRSHLSLTILPTLACNFRCVYCYQKRHSQKTRPETERAILRLVENKIHKGGSLSVSWFGGEPLLQIGIIARLSKELTRICGQNEARFTASITTNGYLLTPETVDKLKACRITDAQVTLDGPPELHDQRRRHRSGKKTFQAILDNVKKASEKMTVSLRMNVDESNKNAIEEMIDILVREGLEKRVGFYLGQTMAYTEVCQDIAAWCLSDKEFSLLGLGTLMGLVKHGFATTYWMPSSRSNFCTADRENSFVITPSGGIVNCWNDSADPKMETGHLLKPCTPRMKANARQWQECDPFQREECVKCSLLPICMGGCPFLFRKTGKPDCHKWSYHLKESLAFYYYYKVVERERKMISAIHEAAEAVKALNRKTRECHPESSSNRPFPATLLSGQ